MKQAIRAARTSILVWDAPVRVFHWLFALSFAGAYLTSGSERWRLAHVTLGYTMAALLVFRLVWGFVGTRHARFSDFVRGPREVLQYLRSMLQGRPAHHTGHNPAGAVAIVALLALCAATTLFGWATYNEFGGEWLSQAHAVLGNTMLVVVCLHIAGVVLGSWQHHENLIIAMVTGRKAGPPEESLRSAWRALAAVLLAAVIGFWALEWHRAPVPSVAVNASVSAQRSGSD